MPQPTDDSPITVPPSPPKDILRASPGKPPPPPPPPPRVPLHPDRRGPLQTMYEDALDDAWTLLSTALTLCWISGGAAAFGGAAAYLLAWLVPYWHLRPRDTPPLDFRLWPFIVAVASAVLVCLLYCLPQVLKRRDALNQRQANHPDQTGR